MLPSEVYYNELQRRFAKLDALFKTYRENMTEKELRELVKDLARAYGASLWE